MRIISYLLLVKLHPFSKIFFILVFAANNAVTSLVNKQGVFHSIQGEGFSPFSALFFTGILISKGREGAEDDCCMDLQEMAKYKQCR